MIRFLIFFLLFPFFSYTQEVVSSLISNPLLYGNQNKLDYNINSVSLPFIDDFSYLSSSSNSNLWKSSSVFINRSYAIDPPTLGVATFDGLDSNGFAYMINISNPDGYADTLMSHNVNLSSIDSAFLLFFYQPKGIGDSPEMEDSLILEFKDINNNWNVVWKKAGADSITTIFRKKFFVINDIDYLHSDFQFRFINKATLSGNFDHWHIDYVKLDQFNSISDLYPIDVSFVYDIPSFLSRYNEMPWRHFKEDMIMNIALLDTIDIKIRNNNASINVDYQYNVYYEGSLTSHYPNSNIWRNVSVFDYDSIGIFSFSNPSIYVDSLVFNPSLPLPIEDSVSFDIIHIIGTGQDDYKINDTVFRKQDFYSHFSYDDGIAESAYGVNVAGAKIAYHFTLNWPDSLRAVQMYFPQMLNSVSDIPFKLTVWNDINGTGSILYQQDSVYPVHTERGDFHTYHLDSAIQIVGDFYVGWEQNTNDLLNIGLDNNLLANQYMYYNTGSGWFNSQFPGSWMIRPIVSSKKLISSIENNVVDCKLYPNPAEEEFFLRCSQGPKHITIYNIHGVIIKSFYSNKIYETINISGLAGGIYIVSVNVNGVTSFDKLIIK
tara:strand:- start:487 stop:2295 length:1809 start_codon:yes stop_codon:yes gene_type:complete